VTSGTFIAVDGSNSEELRPLELVESGSAVGDAGCGCSGAADGAVEGAGAGAGQLGAVVGACTLSSAGLWDWSFGGNAGVWAGNKYSMPTCATPAKMMATLTATRTFFNTFRALLRAGGAASALSSNGSGGGGTVEALDAAGGVA
jgi:hypothetical protein